MRTVPIGITLAGFFTGAFLALAVTSSCSGTPAKCDASTCASGCCTEAGECVGGDQTSACGTGGAACNACGGGEVCTSHACTAGNTGNDAGTDAGMNGDSDAGTDAGMMPMPFATFADFDAARAEATCQLEVKCGMFSTVDACKAAGDQTFGLTAQITAALKDGRVTFDGASGRECVDAIPALSCDDPIGPTAIASCKATVKGAVADGASCFADIDCAATSHCTDDGMTCPATCEARKAAGESANYDEECLDGLYVGFGGTCEEKVPVGESCAGPTNFSPRKTCVPGAYCNDQKMCVAQGKAGDACVNEGDCLPAYACHANVCGVRAASGAACALSPQLNCKLDLICDTTGWDVEGTCSAPKASGGSCIESSQCASGLFCRGMPTPDHCAAPGAVGDMCQPYVDGECAASAYCDTTTTTCQAKIAMGQPCTVDGSCVDEAYCDGTKCQPLNCTDPTP